LLILPEIFNLNRLWAVNKLWSTKKERFSLVKHKDFIPFSACFSQDENTRYNGKFQSFFKQLILFFILKKITNDKPLSNNAL